MEKTRRAALAVIGAVVGFGAGVLIGAVAFGGSSEKSFGSRDQGVALNNARVDLTEARDKLTETQKELSAARSREAQLQADLQVATATTVPAGPRTSFSDGTFGSEAKC